MHIVLVVLSENVRAFLQVGQRARGLPIVGHLRAWATPCVGRVGPRRRESFSFLRIRNSLLFYVVSRTLKININSHRCPKIVK